MKIKIYILILLSLVSCKKDSDQLSLSSINLKEWNANTIKSISESCDIDKNEYNSKMPLNIDNKGDTLTIESHFYEKINNRGILLKELSGSFFKTKIEKLNEVTIVETYSDTDVKGNQTISYEVFFDKDKLLYHLNYDSNEEKFSIKNKPWEDPNDYTLIENGICINKLPINTALNNVSIKNKLVFLDNNIDYFIEYIYLE